jgi:hypothetical protein
MKELTIKLTAEQSELLYDAATKHSMTRECYVKWKVFGNGGGGSLALLRGGPRPSLELRVAMLEKRLEEISPTLT